uniref:Uncharacterized protein n=1 Tax=Meloidogyne hapla TaxID=6305 RepID=A0A1I8AY42_MELHA
MDQCMLHPGQKQHGSYALVFHRHPGLLCDELIICYPSQLSINNTLNGTIPSIPYRIVTKRSELNKKCEEKRKMFCNKNKCSLGQPGSSVWHGIMLKTEYIRNEFITTIKLSITDRM